MTFADQLYSSHLDDGERILYVAHRHLYILIKNSFKTLFFGIFLPIILYLFFPQAILIVLMWLIVGTFGMLYHFIDWFFDAWLITNTGIIDIERHGLFDRNSTRVEYHMVEGLSYSITGVVATILGYGHITLDKLGSQTSLVLKDARNPKKVERILIKFQEKFAREKSFKDHDTLKSMLAEMISIHAQNNPIDN